MIAKNWKILISGIAAAAICGVFGHRGATAQSAPPANGQTAAIVAAADAFMNSLDAAQREKVQFPFTPQKSATAATFSRGGAGRDDHSGGVGRIHVFDVSARRQIGARTRPDEERNG